MDTNKISDLGEFKLIEKLTKDISLKNNSTVKGVGDDAAVTSYGEKKTVISSDLLIEGVHFNLAYAPLKHLGYKSVVVNLSDIYAMNAVPEQIIVSIGISNRFTVEAVEELYAGIHAACESYGVDLVGGDTTSSNRGMVISITAIGTAESEKLCYRSGAKVNDLICVTGDLGAAYAGLRVLEREDEIFRQNPDIQPDLSAYAYIAERQLKPEARADVTELLGKLNIQPSSMIDISDGLSSELMHLCKSSGTGCYVYESKIPIHKQTADFAEETEIPVSVFAMNGGEDYELLFTISQEDYKKIENNEAVKVIGHITEKDKGMYLISNDEKLVPIEAQGWNSFDRE
ncbi:MAG: thiamine-phosphate kinase [Bacteroidota bacterium]|nr:thiamine-phosphate kinase [Bacteroidota bacterium]